MIEILKHGSKKHIITRCPECGCVFRFDDETDTYHDRLYYGNYIDCPECDEKILVHNTSYDNVDSSKFECEILTEDDLQ